MSTERRLGRCRSAALGALLLPILFGGLLTACGPELEDETTEKTVDVEPVAEVPVVDDPKEIPRGQGLSGILPGGFPEDLPLYLPASLIDYGEEGGRPWVDLLTPRSRGAVEEGLRAQLTAAGWQVESAEGGPLRLAKDGRNARVTIRDGNPGTVYRVEY